MNLKNSFFSVIKNPKTAVGFIISFLAILWVFQDLNFSKLKSILQNINIYYLALASILLWACNWFRGLRWSYLFKREESISIASLYRAELIGYFGNNILPLRLGEVLRSHIISQQYSLSTSYVFGTVVLERLIDTLTLGFFACILLFVYPLNEIMKSYVLWGIIISFLIVFSFFCLIRIFPSFQSNGNKVYEIFLNILSGLKSIRREKIIYIIISSFLIWLIYLVDVYLIQKAFGFALTGPQILTLLVISSLALSIPSAPGMIGTFHAAIKFIMVDMFYFTVDEGNAFAILIHGYGYVLLTILGAYYFFKYQIIST
tara:strand:+ start:4276 stop:5223 length:948 start_codon:yes stop_codon:yes gene_type:complete